MADAILLSKSMFDRMKKMLDDYEKGYADSIQLGKGMHLEERGTGYMKFGVNSSLQSASGSSALTVTNGITNVTSVNVIHLDQYLFKLSSSGTGIANVTLNTTTCN